MSKKPHIAEMQLSRLQVRLRGIGVFSASAAGEGYMFVLAFTRVAQAWPVILSRLEGAGISARVGKDSRGKVVLIAKPSTSLEDLSMQITNALSRRSPSQTKSHRFFNDRGWLVKAPERSALFAQAGRGAGRNRDPSDLREPSDPTESGDFSGATYSIEARSTSGRWPLGASGKRNVVIACFTMVLLGVALAIFSATSFEQQAKQPSRKAHGSSTGASVAASTKSADYGLPSSKELGAMLASGASKLSAESFDQDVLLDSFTAAGINVEVLDRVVLGGVAQLRLRLPDRPNAIVARFQVSEGGWQLQWVQER
jgi:hypothetical protein